MEDMFVNSLKHLTDMCINMIVFYTDAITLRHERHATV